MATKEKFWQRDWVRTVLFCLVIFIFSFVGFVFFDLGGGLFVFFVAGWKSFNLQRQELNWVTKLGATLPIMFCALLGIIAGFLAKHYHLPFVDQQQFILTIAGVIYHWLLFLVFYGGWLVALGLNAIGKKVKKQTV